MRYRSVSQWAGGSSFKASCRDSSRFSASAISGNTPNTTIHFKMQTNPCPFLISTVQNRTPQMLVLSFWVPKYIRHIKHTRRPTSCFDEVRVGVVRDERNRQLPEVELEGSGNDVEVLVSI